MDQQLQKASFSLIPQGRSVPRSLLPAAGAQQELAGSMVGTEVPPEERPAGLCELFGVRAGTSGRSSPDNPVTAGAEAVVPCSSCSQPCTHLPGKLVHSSQVLLVQDAVAKSIPKAPEEQEGSL